jgi:hypothetical protein
MEEPGPGVLTMTLGDPFPGSLRCSPENGGVHQQTSRPQQPGGFREHRCTTAGRGGEEGREEALAFIHPDLPWASQHLAFIKGCGSER